MRGVIKAVNGKSDDIKNE